MEPQTTENPTENNPFLAFISKFLKPQQQQQESGASNGSDVASVKREEEVASTRSNKAQPDVVSFPLTTPDVPPLKVENEDMVKDNTPLVLWQIYALGGYLVCKWAWAKWQERKANAKKDESGEGEDGSGEEQPAAHVPNE